MLLLLLLLLLMYCLCGGPGALRVALAWRQQLTPVTDGDRIL
jgi:hypothetical protein